MRRLLRSWRHRVAVAGHSMAPGLRDGDWLLVDPGGSVRAGDLVVARDPRAPARLIVKRVASVDGATVTLTPDHPAHAGDSIGPLRASDVVGRAWLRYWPARRFGRVI